MLFLHGHPSKVLTWSDGTELLVAQKCLIIRGPLLQNRSFKWPPIFQFEGFRLKGKFYGRRFLCLGDLLENRGNFGMMLKWKQRWFDIKHSTSHKELDFHSNTLYFWSNHANLMQRSSDIIISAPKPQEKIRDWGVFFWIPLTRWSIRALCFYEL